MKLLTGVVKSAKTAQTATVEVERAMFHPIYGKRIKLSKKYLVQDEIGVKEGDKVEIKSTRPLSARKHFIITKIIK